MCLIDFYDFDMTIEEICSEQCYPFELENIKLVKLFSFFCIVLQLLIAELLQILMMKD